MVRLQKLCWLTFTQILIFSIEQALSVESEEKGDHNKDVDEIHFKSGIEVTKYFNIAYENEFLQNLMESIISETQYKSMDEIPKINETEPDLVFILDEYLTKKFDTDNNHVTNFMKENKELILETLNLKEENLPKYDFKEGEKDNSLYNLEAIYNLLVIVLYQKQLERYSKKYPHATYQKIEYMTLDQIQDRCEFNEIPKDVDGKPDMKKVQEKMISIRQKEIAEELTKKSKDQKIPLDVVIKRAICHQQVLSSWLIFINIYMQRYMGAFTLRNAASVNVFLWAFEFATKDKLSYVNKVIEDVKKKSNQDDKVFHMENLPRIAMKDEDYLTEFHEYILKKTIEAYVAHHQNKNQEATNAKQDKANDDAEQDKANDDAEQNEANDDGEEEDNTAEQDKATNGKEEDNTDNLKVLDGRTYCNQFFKNEKDSCFESIKLMELPEESFDFNDFPKVESVLKYMFNDISLKDLTESNLYNTSKPSIKHLLQNKPSSHITFNPLYAEKYLIYHATLFFKFSEREEFSINRYCEVKFKATDHEGLISDSKEATANEDDK